MSSTQIESKILEIRWHGRGGQGAKTAALLLADAVLGAGKHIQALPEYGPEPGLFDDYLLDVRHVYW